MVFDEGRIFESGNQLTTFQLQQVRSGVLYAFDRSQTTV